MFWCMCVLHDEDLSQLFGFYSVFNTSLFFSRFFLFFLFFFVLVCIGEIQRARAQSDTSRALPRVRFESARRRLFRQ